MRETVPRQIQQKLTKSPRSVVSLSTSSIPWCSNMWSFNEDMARYAMTWGGIMHDEPSLQPYQEAMKGRQGGFWRHEVVFMDETKEQGSLLAHCKVMR